MRPLDYIHYNFHSLFSLLSLEAIFLLVALFFVARVIFCRLIGFLLLLLLALDVVLGEVAILAHTRGVVRLVWVAACICFLLFSLAMVTVVAHVLGVVLPVSMRAIEDLATGSLNGKREVLHHSLQA
jgi:hypothetical protein